ncbi:MAG: hypothetical protein MZW92_50925 [Comamonadaceae bacterium]|nr:hypothetical protein [Comamonadaceae bacterium]
MPNYAVVIPAYNEAATIRDLAERALGLARGSSSSMTAPPTAPRKPLRTCRCRCCATTATRARPAACGAVPRRRWCTGST